MRWNLADLILMPPTRSVASRRVRSLSPYSRDAKAGSVVPPANPEENISHRVNFVRIADGRIPTDAIVIDPTLPFAADKNPDNLFVSHNDDITIKVEVPQFLPPQDLPEDTDMETAIAKIVLHSREGNVCIDLTDDRGSRPYISLTAISNHGSISLRCPRSLKGRLTILSSSPSSTHYSKEFSKHVNIVSSQNGLEKCYVGETIDFPSKYDVIFLNAGNGSVYISYEGENEKTALGNGIVSRYSRRYQRRYSRTGARMRTVIEHALTSTTLWYSAAAVLGVWT